MTAIPITGLYTGLTIILAIILGAGIGLHRGKTKVSIGDGGDPETLLRMRRHGNLVETAALTLLAMAIIEVNGASATLLHGLGIAYILTRILHPIGLKADDVTHPLRALGAGGSTLVMLIAGGMAIWQFFSGAG
ncbi:MAG: MAPEG family protein [Pseudomonadota bacterium]|nr:MAPEG family protein [Pseudomonadota bacterium]